MWRVILPVLPLLASCSSGAEADLQYIGQARSLGAEWALVNEQAAQGKLTSTYVTTMRASVREQLKTTADSLTDGDSDYGMQIAILLGEPDDASPNVLRAHVDKLKQIEDGLESA
jgi:hypothetical protein